MTGPRKRRRRYYDPGSNPFPQRYGRGAWEKLKEKPVVTDADRATLVRAQGKRARKAARRAEGSRP